MRVKDKFLEKINFLILIFSLCLSHKLYAENIYEKVFNYNDSLKNSSMNFIQTTFQDLQEGEVFFGDERIKINYNNPQKLTIIFSEKKGVYINHELEESEFFLTKKSYIKFFFDVFNNKTYLESMSLKLTTDQIEITENILLDNSTYTIRLVYENDPIKLRRLEILGDDEEIQMGFFNHFIESVFDKKFFSMIDPYPN